jgi:hypothetical protein
MLLDYATESETLNLVPLYAGYTAHLARKVALELIKSARGEAI